MLGALWLLLATLAALLALLITALATPLRLAVTLSTAPSWRLKIAARMFGGLTPPLTIHDSKRRERRVKTPKKAPQVEKTSKSAARRGGVARATRVVAASPRLLTDLLRPIHLRRLSIDADIGLGDPADTGQLFGLIYALTYARPPGGGVSIAVRPDFTEARASGEFDAEASVIPLAFLAPGLRLAWSVYGWRS